MDGVTSVISPVGRALQQKLSGMTQEQFQQYVMQQMNAGVIKSFPEIMALKSQYDALQKGAKQQPAPQGTVADEMAAQMAPQPPMPAPPRDAGVATLPEAQQQFADGGIVAFAGAGGVGTPPAGPATMTPEEFLRFLEEQKAAREAAARVPPPVPATPATAPTPAAPKPSAWRTPIKGANLVKGANAMLGPAVATGIASGVIRAGTSKAGEPELREARGRMLRDTDSLSLPIDPMDLLNPVGALANQLLPFKSINERMMMENEGLIPELMLRTDALTRDIASNMSFGRIRSPYDYLREPAAPAAEKKEEKTELTRLPDSVRRPTAAAPSIGLPTLKRPEIADFDMSGVDKPKERSKYREEIEKDYEQRGIGAKDKEYEAQLAADRKEMEYNKRVAPWMALAQAGFRMAQEGSKSGATFLGSAGAGAEEGLKTYKQLKDDIRVANREQQKAERDLAAAQELRQMNIMKEGNALYSDALNRYDAYTLKKAEHAMKVAEMKFGYEGAIYSAQVNFAIAKMREIGAGDAANKALNQFWDALNRGDLEGAKAVAQGMNYWVNQTSPQLLKAPTGVLNSSGSGSGVQPTSVKPAS